MMLYDAETNRDILPSVSFTVVLLDCFVDHSFQYQQLVPEVLRNQNF